MHLETAMGQCAPSKSSTTMKKKIHVIREPGHMTCVTLLLLLFLLLLFFLHFLLSYFSWFFYFFYFSYFSFFSYFFLLFLLFLLFLQKYRNHWNKMYSKLYHQWWLGLLGLVTRTFLSTGSESLEMVQTGTCKGTTRQVDQIGLGADSVKKTYQYFFFINACPHHFKNF